RRERRGRAGTPRPLRRARGDAGQPGDACTSSEESGRRSGRRAGPGWDAGREDRNPPRRVKSVEVRSRRRAAARHDAIFGAPSIELAPVDRSFVESLALSFQACFTLLQALVYLGLWTRERRAYFATWAWAWGLYALRLGFIVAFLRTRAEAWLFAHEATTWM